MSRAGLGSVCLSVRPGREVHGHPDSSLCLLGAQTLYPNKWGSVEFKPAEFGDFGEVQREKEALPGLRGFGGSGWPRISSGDKVRQQSVQKSILAQIVRVLQHPGWVRGLCEHPALAGWSCE